MIASQAIVKSLEQEDVSVVFGYPGVSVCPIFDQLVESPIRTILVRTEQNAAHAASGYARSKGGVGVCIASSGPGATNLITGIATAFADSIPLVCITGQVKSEHIGSDMFQEADIVGATESFVKYSYLVKSAKDLPRILKEAFYIASTGRKGPVLVDIPVDIQMEEIGEFVYPETVSLRTYKPTVKGHAVQIKKVIGALAEAKRPILCVGGGVISSGAQKEVQKFAGKFKVPVVSTLMGLGTFETENPLYIGMVGNNGKRYANRAMNASDLLIMVGARVADRAVKQPDLITKGKVLIHIDVDTAEIGKNAGVSIPIVGDAKSIFKELNSYEANTSFDEWIEEIEGLKKEFACIFDEEGELVPPHSFVSSLSAQMKDDAIYVADVGQNQIYSCSAYVVKKGKFLTSGGMGTMGYSIPAAMGAKLATPKKQVVCVCGDGAFQMSMPELATIVSNQLDVKIFVMNNASLGMIREYQKMYYNKHYTMNELGRIPDISLISKAYGIPYYSISEETECEDVIKQVLECEQGCICEVFVDKDARCFV